MPAYALQPEVNQNRLSLSSHYSAKLCEAIGNNKCKLNRKGWQATGEMAEF